MKEKFREKKSKCFFLKFEVKDFAKFVFTGWAFCCLKLKFCVAEKKSKLKIVWVVSHPVSWASCCETWLKVKDKMKIAVGNESDC